MIIDENMVYLNYKKIIKKNILRPQCNTTKAKPHNSNRETKEEQNNYQMWIEKIQEQFDTETDKCNIKERYNSSEL